MTLSSGLFYIFGGSGMNLHLLAKATIVAGILCFGSSAHADSITFQQGPTYNTGGTTIRSDRPLVAEDGFIQKDRIIVGYNHGTAMRGLLEFDLSAIEAATGGLPYIVDSVTLTVSSFIAGSGAVTAVQYDLDLLGNNLDFDETTVTWNNAPSIGGGTIGTFLSSVSYNPNVAGSVGNHTFADTSAFRSAVQNALNNDPDDTIRFLLKSHAESGGNFTVLNSDESTAMSDHPSLTIDYTVITPLPGAAGAGLVLLGCLGFRRSPRQRA
jgi:hypothetical protein